MNAEQAYQTWAPPDATWSPWAKPILFAQDWYPRGGASGESREWPSLAGARWLPNPKRQRAAIIVNLPGAESLAVGVMLAHQGYRPVPLFNGCDGAPHPAVDMRPLLSLLPEVTEELARIELLPDAPPAFLLDAGRCPYAAPGPGQFDNRWLTFPQDFPSARFLKEHMVEQVILVERSARGPQDDLLHVLKRFQDAGLQIHRADIHASSFEPLLVVRPTSFRSLFYRFSALIGLRRSSVGGFGSLVPMPSESSGRGWG